MLLEAVLAKPCVAAVRVVEIDADVIALVGPRFAADPRLEIVHGDAFEHTPRRAAGGVVPRADPRVRTLMLRTLAARPGRRLYWSPRRCAAPAALTGKPPRCAWCCGACLTPHHPEARATASVGRESLPLPSTGARPPPWRRRLPMPQDPRVLNRETFKLIARRLHRQIKDQPASAPTLLQLQDTLAQALGHKNLHAAQAWWDRAGELAPRSPLADPPPAPNKDRRPLEHGVPRPLPKAAPHLLPAFLAALVALASAAACLTRSGRQAANPTLCLRLSAGGRVQGPGRRRGLDTGGSSVAGSFQIRTFAGRHRVCSSASSMSFHHMSR